MAIVSRVDYENAEARGRIRQWKKRLEREYIAFNHGYSRLQKGDLRNLPVDMVRCGRVGRRRACEKISAALGPGAKLELSILDDPHPRAIWSIYKPRDAVTCDAPIDAHESLFQDCVTVNYFVAGSMPGMMIGVGEGLWTLEVPDHALGRAVERSRLLHPGTLIHEAHATLLALPNSILGRSAFTNVESRGVYIKAGAGAFAGHLHIAPDISIDDQYSAHVRVKTWLSDDQLRDDQIVLSKKGKPGDRLGDGWLLPRPFARINRTNQNQFDVSVWFSSRSQSN